MRISFCTTCMGRLYHLKETILKNIENASSYPDCEFVLLDYNSNDGLREWASEKLGGFMESGKVAYYMTREPFYFIASHAKNIAHRMATGDILCNIDADVSIPPGFCEYLKDVFVTNPLSIVSFSSEDMNGNSGCAGLIAAQSSHFYSVNGYDEDIYIGWGYDDMNYQFRCRMQNDLKLITPERMCSCIPHSNEVRTKNFQLKYIEMTRELSYAICQKAAEDKDYIANKEGEWGEAVLFKNLSDTPLT